MPSTVAVPEIAGIKKRRSSSRGLERAIVNQTNIRTVSKAALGKLNSERQGGAYMGFSERIDTILNRTELNGN